MNLSSMIIPVGKERPKISRRYYEAVCAVAIAAFLLAHILLQLNHLFGYSICTAEQKYETWTRDAHIFTFGAFVCSFCAQCTRIKVTKFKDQKKLGTLQSYYASLCVTFIAGLSNISTLVYDWGGTCEDHWGVRTPAAHWTEWMVCVPLMAFITLSVDGKTTFDSTDRRIILNLFLCIFTGALLQVFSSSALISYTLFTFSTIFCAACIRVMILSNAQLSILLNSPLGRHSNNKGRESRRIMLASRKATLANCMGILFPLFPGIYGMAMAGLLGPNEVRVGLLLVSAFTKLLFAGLCMDAHLEVSHPSIALIDAEEYASTSRNTFLRYVFHELRIPLNSIALAVHLLSGLPAALNETGAETVAMISDAVSYMGETLNDVMVLQKIEEGSIEIITRPFSLDDLFANIKDAFAQQLMTSPKKVSLVFKVENAELSRVVGDKLRIRHVLVNLISNAIQFSRPNGTVTVYSMVHTYHKKQSDDDLNNVAALSFCQHQAIKQVTDIYGKQTNASSPSELSHAAEKTQPASARSISNFFASIAISAIDTIFTYTSPPPPEFLSDNDDVGSENIVTADLGNDDGNGSEEKTKDTRKSLFSDPAKTTVVTFAVIDNGTGITQEKLNGNIFLPFKVLKTGSMEKGRGSGLGLAICKEIVQLHGGAIHYISEPGNGCIFYVSIPMAIAPRSKKSLNGHKNRHPSRIYTEKIKRETSLTNNKLQSFGLNALSPHVNVLRSPSSALKMHSRTNSPLIPQSARDKPKSSIHGIPALNISKLFRLSSSAPTTTRECEEVEIMHNTHDSETFSSVNHSSEPCLPSMTDRYGILSGSSESFNSLSASMHGSHSGDDTARSDISDASYVDFGTLHREARMNYIRETLMQSNTPEEIDDLVGFEPLISGDMNSGQSRRDRLLAVSEKFGIVLNPKKTKMKHSGRKGFLKSFKSHDNIEFINRKQRNNFRNDFAQPDMFKSASRVYSKMDINEPEKNKSIHSAKKLRSSMKGSHSHHVANSNPKSTTSIDYMGTTSLHSFHANESIVGVVDDFPEDDEVLVPPLAIQQSFKLPKARTLSEKVSKYSNDSVSASNENEASSSADDSNYYSSTSKRSSASSYDSSDYSASSGTSSESNVGFTRNKKAHSNNDLSMAVSEYAQQIKLKNSLNALRDQWKNLLSPQRNASFSNSDPSNTSESSDENIAVVSSLMNSCLSLSSGGGCKSFPSTDSHSLTNDQDELSSIMKSNQDEFTKLSAEFETYLNDNDENNTTSKFIKRKMKKYEISLSSNDELGQQFIAEVSTPTAVISEDISKETLGIDTNEQNISTARLYHSSPRKSRSNSSDFIMSNIGAVGLNSSSRRKSRSDSELTVDTPYISTARIDSSTRKSRNNSAEVMPNTKTSSTVSTFESNEEISGMSGKNLSQANEDSTQHCRQPSDLKVLIVDDVKSNRKLLTLLLKQKGVVTVDSAEDGVIAVAAVESTKECPYDIIFMDNTMPHMTGIEAVAVLRKNGFQNVIIGVTGNSMEDELAHFVDQGADLVITKPMKGDLLDTIFSFLLQNGVKSQINSKLILKNDQISWNSIK